jgi:hypothetical protein
MERIVVLGPVDRRVPEKFITFCRHFRLGLTRYFKKMRLADPGLIQQTPSLGNSQHGNLTMFALPQLICPKETDTNGQFEKRVIELN